MNTYLLNSPTDGHIVTTVTHQNTASNGTDSLRSPTNGNSAVTDNAAAGTMKINTGSGKRIITGGTTPDYTIIPGTPISEAVLHRYLDRAMEHGHFQWCQYLIPQGNGILLHKAVVTL